MKFLNVLLSIGMAISLLAYVGERVDDNDYSNQSDFFNENSFDYIIELSYGDLQGGINGGIHININSNVVNDEFSEPETSYPEISEPEIDYPELTLERAQTLVNISCDDSNTALMRVLHAEGVELNQIDQLSEDGGIRIITTFSARNYHSVDQIRTILSKYLTDDYINSYLTDENGNLRYVEQVGNSVYVQDITEARGYPMYFVKHVEEVSPGVYCAYCEFEFSSPGDPYDTWTITYDNGYYKVG